MVRDKIQDCCVTSFVRHQGREYLRQTLLNNTRPVPGSKTLLSGAKVGLLKYLSILYHCFYSIFCFDINILDNTSFVIVSSGGEIFPTVSSTVKSILHFRPSLIHERHRTSNREESLQT